MGRLWRDAKLYEIGAGTSEIRRMLIGANGSRKPCDAGAAPQGGSASLTALPLAPN